MKKINRGDAVCDVSAAVTSCEVDDIESGSDDIAATVIFVGYEQ